MSVITHHPVIIHFKSIGGGYIAVDEYLSILFFEFVFFKYPDNPPVETNIGGIELNGRSLFRDQDGSVVIDIPPVNGIKWKQIRIPLTFWLNFRFN